MRLTPEILTLWVVMGLCLLLAWLVAGRHVPTAQRAPDDLFGPVESFTTRRVPAGAFLQP